MNTNDTGKTFPLRLSKEFHAMIVEAAKKMNIPIHQFIIETLQKHIQGGNENE